MQSDFPDSHTTKRDYKPLNNHSMSQIANFDYKNACGITLNHAERD